MDEKCAKIEKGVLIEYDDMATPFPPIGYDIVPSNVKKIGAFAFANCHEILELYIPWYVKEIPETNFVDRTGDFEKMHQSPNFTIFGEKDTVAEIVAKQAGVNFVETNAWIVNNKLYNYFGKSEKFAIPEGIVSTWGEAFNLTPYIEEVTLPTTLKYISSKSFLNCKKIKKITIPKGVNGMGSEVFKNCKSLTEIVFENGDTKMDNNCFKGCPDILVKAPAGGFVEDYAIKNNLRFQAI